LCASCQYWGNVWLWCITGNCDQHVAWPRLRDVPSCAVALMKPFVTTWE
jgi:hypothetical protein